MNEQLERNKQAVLAFYDLMFNQCRPAEAMPVVAPMQRAQQFSPA